MPAGPVRNAARTHTGRMSGPVGGQHHAMALTVQPVELKLALPPVAESAGRARRALLKAGVGEDLEHTVTLLTTELVANAVKHAGMQREDRIILLATLEPDFAHVEVHDRGPGFDADVRHETKGFGLRLIDTLATRWSVERHGGCAVWFEVDRRSRRFRRT
jgi:anti-sigma regulatory factor (Ser/Thr protein kinase)